MTLPAEQWSKLTENHKWALSILRDAQSHGVEPMEPRSMKTALHDLWRFGFADRKFQDGMSMRYQITFLGLRAASEALEGAGQ